MLKRLARSPMVAAAAGRALAAYLRLVTRTTRFAREPADLYEPVAGHMPFILASWHGEHLLVPLMRRPDHRIAALVSRSADGEINAAALRALGVEAIRASGGRNRLKAARKGAVRGFLEMLSALERGVSVAQTADVPRGEPRRCGRGIVTLAKHSGRPVVPCAVATAAAVTLPTWDRTRIPLPFGRGAMVVAPPIYVAADADAGAVEAARLAVEAALDAARERAHELAAARR